MNVQINMTLKNILNSIKFVKMCFAKYFPFGEVAVVPLEGGT